MENPPMHRARILSNEPGTQMAGSIKPAVAWGLPDGKPSTTCNSADLSQVSSLAWSKWSDRGYFIPAAALALALLSSSALASLSLCDLEGPGATCFSGITHKPEEPTRTKSASGFGGKKGARFQDPTA